MRSLSLSLTFSLLLLFLFIFSLPYFTNEKHVLTRTGSFWSPICDPIFYSPLLFYRSSMSLYFTSILREKEPLYFYSVCQCDNDHHNVHFFLLISFLTYALFGENYMLRDVQKYIRRYIYGPIYLHTQLHVELYIIQVCRHNSRGELNFNGFQTYKFFAFLAILPLAMLSHYVNSRKCTHLYQHWATFCTALLQAEQLFFFYFPFIISIQDYSQARFNVSFIWPDECVDFLSGRCSNE